MASTHLDYLKRIAAGVDDPRALAQEAIEEGVAIDQLKLLGGEKAGPRPTRRCTMSQRWLCRNW